MQPTRLYLINVYLIIDFANIGDSPVITIAGTCVPLRTFYPIFLSVSHLETCGICYRNFTSFREAEKSWGYSLFIFVECSCTFSLRLFLDGRMFEIVSIENYKH